jgi:PAS domain S-box-containing protein
MSSSFQLLVVEHEKADLLSLLGPLEEAGIITEIQVAKNTHEGLELLSSSDFDLVVLDKSTPIGLGMTFVEEVRNKNISTPIIIADHSNNSQHILDYVKTNPTDDGYFKGTYQEQGLIEAVNHISNVYKLKDAHKLISKNSEIDFRYRLLISYAPLAIISFDEENVIIDWNPEAERLFGWSAEEVLNQKFNEMVLPPTEREIHLEKISHYISEIKQGAFNKRLSINGWTKDGKKIPVESSILPIKLKDKYIFLAFINDLSKIREQEEKLNKFLTSLEESSRELQRSNRDLEQFAYIASHDLQEPLRMITSYVQLLKIRYKNILDNEGQEFINYIFDGANRMKMLINDLLDYSRVGSRNSKFEDIDLNHIMKNVVTDLQEAIRESGAEIHSDNLPAIFGDTPQIKRLFQNLISNAIKFRGDSKPVIHINTTLVKDRWIISVKDNGIGIRPSHFDRIFVIFQRLHDSDEYPGSGIGLAIAKKIIENHNGTISVSSEHGRGSTFTLTFPLKSDSPLMAASEADLRQISA